MHDAYLPILPFLDTVEGVTLLDLDPQALDRTLHNFESWLDEGLFQRSYNPFFPSAQERARKFYKQLRTVSNKEEILSQSDVLLVTTPPYTHIDLVMDIIRNGKKAILEKPITSDLAALQDLLPCYNSLFEENVRYLDNYMYYPPINHLKDKIQHGAIGDTILIETCMANPGPAKWRDAPLWRIDKSKSGGGVLYDWGPHTIGLSLYLAGPHKEIISLKTLSIEYSKPGQQISGEPIPTPIDLRSLVSIVLGEEGHIPTTLLVENSWLNSPDQDSPSGKSWIRVEGTEGSCVMEIKKIGSERVYNLTTSLRRDTPICEVFRPHFPHDSFFYGLDTILRTWSDKIPPKQSTFSFGLKILKIIHQVTQAQ